MANTRDLIRQSERLVNVPAVAAGTRSRPVDYPPSATSVVGVLRAVEGDKLRWQRIRYKHKPPQLSAADAVEAYGSIEDGYPIEGGTASAFLPFVYAPEVIIGKDVVPMDCAPRGGNWILQPCTKLGDLVVPPGEPLPGCSYG